MVVERGDVWWADLGEPERSEPGYRRPVIVIQSDAFNSSRIRTVIVVALMTNLRLLESPGNVLIVAGVSGLPRDSVANISQVLTIDREFLLEHTGKIRGRTLKRLEDGVRLVLAL